jgi:signal transduction histidine kinase
MNRHRKGAIVFLLIYFSALHLILLCELPLLEPAQRFSYSLGKLFFAWTALPLAFWLWRSPMSVWGNVLVGINFAGYTVFCALYRPNYYYVFAELGFAISFVFSIPKRHFRSLIVVWSLAFVTVMRLTWEQQVAAMRSTAYSDIVLAIFAFALIALISHTYFTADRMFRETALARFSRMGLQASRLIHDLKGLTASPKLYAEMITERLADKADPHLTQALEALSRDLENLNRIVVELNQLTTVAPNKIEDFNFSEVLDSTRAILGGRLRNVRLESSVCARIHSDSSMLSSILLNLFLLPFPFSIELRLLTSCKILNGFTCVS